MKKIIYIFSLLFVIITIPFIKYFYNSCIPINNTIIKENMIIKDKYKTFAKVPIYNIEVEGIDSKNNIKCNTNKEIYEKIKIGETKYIVYELIEFRDDTYSSNFINIK